MDRVAAYLKAIEEINRAHRRLERRGRDATSVALLEGALDGAKVAWQLIPADWQARLAPPPNREDYLPS